MNTAVLWPLADILARVETGDGWSWDQERRWLWEQQPRNMAGMRDNLDRNGIREPVVIARTEWGWRMWDGHHRVVLAADLGWTHLPVIEQQEQAA